MSKVPTLERDCHILAWVALTVTRPLNRGRLTKGVGAPLVIPLGSSTLFASLSSRHVLFSTLTPALMNDSAQLWFCAFAKD